MSDNIEHAGSTYENNHEENRYSKKTKKGDWMTDEVLTLQGTSKEMPFSVPML